MLTIFATFVAFEVSATLEAAIELVRSRALPPELKVDKYAALPAAIEVVSAIRPTVLRVSLV